MGLNSYTTTGYHTVEDRGNYSDILRMAPFECTRSDAWLSHGYYFWDDDPDQAHAWGRAAWKNNYVICKANLTLVNMLDLLSVREHQIFMKKLIQLFQEEHPDVVYAKPPCLSEVIAYFRIVNEERLKGVFPFDSVRSFDVPAKHEDYYFVDGKKEFTSLDMRIQICLFKANSSNSRPLSIYYRK